MDKSKPSYFERLENEYRSLVDQVAVNATGEVSQQLTELAEESFKFFRSRIAQSYWNGVEAAASGRVKPKAKARQSSRA